MYFKYNYVLIFFFSANEFGNEGFKYIGDLLKSSKSLKELRLNCNIRKSFLSKKFVDCEVTSSDDGFEAFCDGLSLNQDLNELQMNSK